MPPNPPAGKWKRLANPVVDERAIAKAADQLGAANRQERIAWILDYHAQMVRAGAQFWRSPEFLVAMVDAAIVWPAEHKARIPDMWWLRIYRHDGKRLRHHWAELQQIKNELVGPENQGLEFYPPESQLQDGENSYHLWVFKDAQARLPFGLPWTRSSGADGLKAIPTRFIVEGPRT